MALLTREKKAGLRQDSIFHKPDTKCWGCAKATGFCSWSAYGKQKPIDGWTAIKTQLRNTKTINGKRGAYDISYIVIDCPAFVPDGTDERAASADELKRFLGKLQGNQ